MTLAEFLTRFQDTGEIRFTSPDPVSLDPGEEADAIQQLIAMDERRRLEMAHEPPPFRTEPGIWAARLTYRICQCLVYREIPAERIQVDLQEACPGDPGPARSYSVDLTLFRLPELLQRAASIASADPLLIQLQRLAWEWPLSSVGIPVEVVEGGPEPDLSSIVDQPALLQLYADRVIASQDRTRLHHPAIAAAVRNSVGMHPELARGLGLDSVV